MSAGHARAIWQAGVDAVHGETCVARALSDADAPDAILAVGKAAAAMARAALARFGSVPALVVTKDGHGADLPPSARLIEAAHPVPDARSLAAGRDMAEAVGAMATGSRLLLLVSGGASALAEDLTEGHSLADLAALNSALLASGQDITGMNAARRRISRIKGGGLLGGFVGDSVHVLAISDVPGDDLAVIGSGIAMCPDGASFHYSSEIVGSNAIARTHAERTAEGLGHRVQRNEEALHCALTELAALWGPRIATMPTGAIILGGEPTVILPENPGRGGRNQALALALSEHIAGIEGLTVLVGGTDGSDGPTQDAGAIVTGKTWSEGAKSALLRADAGTFLAARNALLTTGPTGTNVMDLLVAIRH